MFSQRDLCESVLVRVANYMRNAGERRNFGGGALSITARHNDFAVGILPADAPNRRPRVLFCRGSHRASVQDNVLCPSRRLCPEQSQLPKLPFNCGAVRLSSPAAEIFYVKAGHASILAYIHLRMRGGRAPATVSKLR